MTTTTYRSPADSATTTVALPHPCAGLVVGIIDHSSCWVTLAHQPSSEAQRASVLLHLGEVVVGQTVLLQFLAGNPAQPVVVGVMPVNQATDTPAILEFKNAVDPENVVVNGESININAKKKIVFRCGKASLTLHANGNIEIRGTELLSRASKQNAIRGASITLN